MYGVLALVIVVVSAFTGGGLMKAIFVAAAFFAGANRVELVAIQPPGGAGT